MTEYNQIINYIKIIRSNFSNSELTEEEYRILYNNISFLLGSEKKISTNIQNIEHIQINGLIKLMKKEANLNSVTKEVTIM